MRKTLRFQVDGVIVRLTSRPAWEAAIARGDLTPETAVVVEVNGTEVYSGSAGDAHGWTGLFLPDPETVPNEADAEEYVPTPPAPPVVPVFSNPPPAPRPLAAGPAPEPTPDPTRGGTDATLDKEWRVVPGLRAAATKPLGPSNATWVVIGLVVLVLLATATGLFGEPRGQGRDAPAFDLSSTSAPAEVTANSSEMPVGLALATDTFHDWSASAPTTQPYLVDGLSITLDAVQTAEGTVPALTVTDATGNVHKVFGVVGFDTAAARFAVVRAYPASEVPQVIFTTFSGGAHCCTQVQVLDRVDGRWRTIDLGAWDGEGVRLPVDRGGDAGLELTFVDNRFLYAFGSYAESEAPPRLYALNAGRAQEVSARADYRRVFLEYAAEVQGRCRAGSNPACAAYVAAAARGGRLSEAWAFMLEHHNARSDWQLPMTCPDGKSKCDEAEQVAFTTFPEALQAFLGDTGYMPASYVLPRGTGDGPSFSCRNARGAVLTLICADADLSAADRQVAAEYTRAMAFSLDRETLQSEQRRFLQARDALGPDPYLIGEHYETRRRQLASCRYARYGCGGEP